MKRIIFLAMFLALAGCSDGGSPPIPNASALMAAHNSSTNIATSMGKFANDGPDVITSVNYSTIMGFTEYDNVNKLAHYCDSSVQKTKVMVYSRLVGSSMKRLGTYSNARYSSGWHANNFPVIFEQPFIIAMQELETDIKKHCQQPTHFVS